jgi:hypothetical protein
MLGASGSSILHDSILDFASTTPLVTCLSRALDGGHPNRSAPGGSMFLWILRFDNNRLTLVDFRDVHLLAV